MDDVTPPCQTGVGCWIPPLPTDAARVLALRDKLIRLRRLGIGAEIMRMYQVTLDDLDLLALIDNELNPREDNPHGDGSDLDTDGEG